MPDPTSALRFPVLVGDIGGTNARFRLLVDPAGEPQVFPVVQTADYAGVEDAIAAIVLPGLPTPPRSVVLALAGPIDGDAVALTNCHWVVRPKVLIETLGFEDVLLLNVFEAQALAVCVLPPEGSVRIGGGTAVEGAGRVVVGPGTGLGVAGLVRAGGLWIPVAGEGGHVDLGPRTERDHEIWPHLTPIEGRISAEQVLCGRGLVHLYRAICAADGAEPVHATPAEITLAAIEGGDGAAAEAVDLFAVYLGRLAGDLALVFMARGGVYIAGGIFARIVPVVKQAQMRAAFDDKAPHSALLSAIPLHVITEPFAALAGLAAYARAPQDYGLETVRRRWRADLAPPR